MKAFEPVKVDSCKSCGSSVSQYNPNSLTIICGHCGTHTVNNEQVPSVVVDNPLFKLYGNFEYKSKLWQIIGCISYTGRVREWDAEDNTWEYSSWAYDSWWVINDTRELIWITHDSAGYKWANKTTMSRDIPENDRTWEKGNWFIKSAAGEFSYFPKVGAQSETYEKGSSNIEISLDDNGQRKEIESFVSTPIDRVELLEIFGKTDILAGIARAKIVKKAIIASIVCLLIGYFVLSLRSETLFTVKPTPFKYPVTESVPIGKMDLDSGALVQFSFQASSLPSGDGSFNANIEIRDDKNALVTQVPINFWRQSGRDSDGSWTETSRSTAPRIKLPKNKYSLSLKPRTFSNWKAITVSGQLKKNVVSGFPLIMGGILLVFLFILQSVLNKKYINKHTGNKS